MSNLTDQLWVADPTYITIAGGFVYATLILDAWSRRVVGCAIGRSIDACLAVKALRSAIAERRPFPGCVFHTDPDLSMRRGCIEAFSPNSASSDL